MNTANSGITGAFPCRNHGAGGGCDCILARWTGDCQVWVNGHDIGQHQGGYDAFTFDITDALRWNGAGGNFVCVTDPTERRPAARQTIAQTGGDFLHVHFRHLADGLAGTGAGNVH